MRTSTTIFTKKIWIHHFGKFTSIWNFVHCQYCTVPQLLCCIILHCNANVVTCVVSMKYCLACPQNVKRVLTLGKILRTLSYIKETWLNTTEMFQIKIYDNTNLILIWSHHHFQQNVKVPFCQKYQCWSPKNVLPVCHHRICLWFNTSTWSPEKCVSSIPPTNLFVVRVPFWILVH